MNAKKVGTTKTGIIVLTILIGGGILIYHFSSVSKPQEVPTTTITAPIITTVTALGRLEPKGEIIKVSASSGTQGNRVEKLLVQEGERVEQGQIIAILDNNKILAGALEKAQGQLKVAEAKLAQIKAGAKTGEIEAQRAIVARIQTESNNNILAQTAIVERLTAEVENAQIEYQRHEQLYENGGISASERDNKRLILETSQRQLEEGKATLERIKTGSSKQIEEAQATLQRISEVRLVDIAVAEAEITQARGALTQAKAELELSYIRAPQEGQILEILTYPGEMVNNEGIVTMGQTQHMYAIAEVYETDITKIKIGQQAKITSHAITEELSGIVEEIGLEVKRQQVVNTDPAANIDAKIVEVKIALDEESSQKVSGLTNLLVTIKIIL